VFKGSGDSFIRIMILKEATIPFFSSIKIVLSSSVFFFWRRLATDYDALADVPRVMCDGTHADWRHQNC
jgi:hypothetical protein